MSVPVPSPVFTFRGHRVGVTALVHCEPSTLYSADEKGNIICWDLTTFKQLSIWNNICDSKVLAIKIIKLTLDSVINSEIFVIQSRNDGVQLRTLDTFRNVGSFPTFKSLFSRGDAITLRSRNEAVLAFPSIVDSHLVTVRYLGENAETLVSGSAQRQDEDKKRRESSVFDIQIKYRDVRGSGDELYLFTAYEDGCLVVYSLNHTQLKTVPELNVTGLKIDSLQKFDFGLSDFVSAFDVTSQDNDKYMLVCGSPKKELVFASCNLNHDVRNMEKHLVIMTKPGVSAISIRKDQKLVAVAGWDNSIRLYSMKSRVHLATLRNHSMQVSALIFAPCALDQTRTLMFCGSLDGTISLIDIYN